MKNTHLEFYTTPFEKNYNTIWHSEGKEGSTVVFREIVKRTESTIDIFIKNPSKVLLPFGEVADSLSKEIKLLLQSDVKIRLILYSKKLCCCNTLCGFMENGFGENDNISVKIKYGKWDLPFKFATISDGKRYIMRQRGGKMMQWCPDCTEIVDEMTKMYDSVYDNIK